MCHTNLVLQFEFSNNKLGECFFFHALSNEMSPCPRLTRIRPILTAFRLCQQSKQNKTLVRHSSSSLCSHSAPWLGEGFSMLLPHLPILRYPLPDGTLPVDVQFLSPPSRRSSSRSFPSVWFPGGDTLCPSVILYHTDVPCPGPHPSSNCFNHICELCLFSFLFSLFSFLFSLFSFLFSLFSFLFSLFSFLFSLSSLFVRLLVSTTGKQKRAKKAEVGKSDIYIYI